MQLTEHFHIDEFRCKDGTGVPYDLVDNITKLAESLEVLRAYLGVPIIINSGYRNPTYNKLVVKGASASKHMKAIAADIRTLIHSPQQIHDAIEILIAEGKMRQGGLGLYNSFVHYDIRGSKARWDNS